MAPHFSLSDPEHSATSGRPTLPPAAGGEALAEATVIESSGLDGSPVNSTQAATAFHCGDIVAIDRNGVNCRAWMSTVAPIKQTLRKGMRGTVLSDPFDSDGRAWVRLRVHDVDDEGYVATRYIELIESQAAAEDGPPIASDPRPRTHVEVRADDLLVTANRARLRSEPGLEAPVLCTVTTNILGRVLGEPIQRNEMVWVPVEFSGETGWMAVQNTLFLNSSGRWLDADLTNQTLTAWADATAVRTLQINSGKSGHPTPLGPFRIMQKIPVRRLRGAVRGEQWNLQGVPWVMIFREGGFYIHSAYWQEEFGQAASHGCITLAPAGAEWLYQWTPLDTPIWIHR